MPVVYRQPYQDCMDMGPQETERFSLFPWHTLPHLNQNVMLLCMRFMVFLLAYALSYLIYSRFQMPTLCGYRSTMRSSVLCRSSAGTGMPCAGRSSGSWSRRAWKAGLPCTMVCGLRFDSRITNDFLSQSMKNARPKWLRSSLNVVKMKPQR